MTTHSRATVHLTAWKQHRCVHCGSTFRYQAQRTTTAAGNTEEEAAAQARIWGENALAGQVCRMPCPACGAYQPDRRSRRRVGFHLLVVVLALVLGLPVVVALHSESLASRNVVSLVAAGLGVLVLLGHLWILRDNPNRTPAVHYRRDVGDAATAKLEVVEAAGPNTGPVGEPHRTDGVARLAVVLFALGVVALALPEIVRVVRGWSLNQGWDPPVAGPGDKVYYYFPERLDAVKDYWRGTATLEVLKPIEAGRADGLTPSVSTRSADWGKDIRLSKHDEKPLLSRTIPWVSVQIPENERLAGATLNLRLLLKVTYPEWKGRSTFENVQREFNHTGELRLGSSRAAFQYLILWWAGMIGGGAMMLLGSGLLIWRAYLMRKQMPPATVTIIDEK